MHLLRHATYETRTLLIPESFSSSYTSDVTGSNRPLRVLRANKNKNIKKNSVSGGAMGQRRRRRVAQRSCSSTRPRVFWCYISDCTLLCAMEMNAEERDPVGFGVILRA